MTANPTRTQEFAAFMIEWNLKNFAPQLLIPFRLAWARTSDYDKLIEDMRLLIQAGWHEITTAAAKHMLGGHNGEAIDMGQEHSTSPVKKTSRRRKGKA